MTVDHAVVPQSLSVLPGFSFYVNTALTKHPVGVWSSDTNDVVEVHRHTGMVTALKSGSAVIFYHVKDLVSLSCDVS